MRSTPCVLHFQKTKAATSKRVKKEIITKGWCHRVYIHLLNTKIFIILLEPLVLQKYRTKTRVQMPVSELIWPNETIFFSGNCIRKKCSCYIQGLQLCVFTSSLDGKSWLGCFLFQLYLHLHLLQNSIKLKTWKSTFTYKNFSCDTCLRRHICGT